MPNITTKDGAVLFYEESGQGQPLILIHGWSGNHLFFREQIEPFSAHYRVIALDLRGHGQSDRSSLVEQNMTMETLALDLRELIEQLELQKPALLCWSMGCLIAYEYIRQYGNDSLSSLILVDMTPKTVNAPDWTYGQGRTETYEDVVNWCAFCARDWQQAAAFFTPRLFANGIPTGEQQPLLDWVTGQAKNNLPHVMVSLVLSMSVSDYRDVLGSISLPVLLIHGENSVMYGKEHGEYLVSRIPNCRLSVLPGGHLMFMEHPGIFTETVLRFMSDI